MAGQAAASVIATEDLTVATALQAVISAACSASTPTTT